MNNKYGFVFIIGGALIHCISMLCLISTHNTFYILSVYFGLIIFLIGIVISQINYSTRSNNEIK